MKQDSGFYGPSKSRPDFNNVRDIQGAMTGSARQETFHQSLGRNTNPLEPNYQMIGQTELFPELNEARQKSSRNQVIGSSNSVHFEKPPSR